MYITFWLGLDLEEVSYNCLCLPEKWLEPDRTLGEQGVTATTEIRLRKKAFFSDGSVDITDLVQLNLIYVQVNNMSCVFLG